MQWGGVEEQHPAVAAVGRRAAGLEANALARLSAFDIDEATIVAATEHLFANSRLTLNFHPDRRDSLGRTVAAGLLSDGRYRSQFETGISNGGRFAVPGGDRTRWESALFDDAYDNGTLSRPVYGALDPFGDSYGGAPRFGSSFVVLESHCLARATFCVGDSHSEPVDIGTLREPLSILAGAFDRCSTGTGFGRGLTVDRLLTALGKRSSDSLSARELDSYIEAQIHGSVDFERDVQAIVLDPSFRGSAVERDLTLASERFGFAIGWNEGSEVRPEQIPPEFRGGDMLDLARATARPDGLLDAAAIGTAIANVPFTAPSIEGDPEASPRQRYKKLWHCCLKFGRPIPGPPARDDQRD
ncbi:MAG: DUF3626 domain-containing protein [Acidimicrobiales bacterium]